MRYLIRTLTVLVAFSQAAAPQTSAVAQIERRGDSAILSVNTFRPLQAISTKLSSQFGISVFAEDPSFNSTAIARLSVGNGGHHVWRGS